VYKEFWNGLRDKEIGFAVFPNNGDIESSVVLRMPSSMVTIVVESKEESCFSVEQARVLNGFNPSGLDMYLATYNPLLRSFNSLDCT